MLSDLPIPLIEYFGAYHLQSAFIFITFMTSPAWIAMILFPRSRQVRYLMQPFIVPPIYCLFLFYLLWKSYLATLLPDPIDSISYSAAKEFTRHPIVFLAFFCNLQILNLAVGTMIFQKANQLKIRAFVELSLCWVVGAPALLIFGARVLLVRKQRH